MDVLHRAQGAADLAVQLAPLVAGVAEHDHLVHPLLAAEEVGEGVDAVAAHVQEVVLQGTRGLLVAVQLDLDRLLQVLGGEVLDRRGHGRRPQQHGVLLQQAGEDEVHVLDEAHVEHLVGLVEDDGAHLLQVDAGVPDQVDEAARRGHEDVDAVVELALLHADVEAAEDGEGHHVGVARHVVDLLHVLHGQLAGRHEDEVLHDPELRVGHVHQGDGAGRSLARSGLGEADHVAAAEDLGDGLLLDGGHVPVAHLVEGRQDLGLEVQVREFQGDAIPSRWCSSL